MWAFLFLFLFVEFVVESEFAGRLVEFVGSEFVVSEFAGRLVEFVVSEFAGRLVEFVVSELAGRFDFYGGVLLDFSVGTRPGFSSKHPMPINEIKPLIYYLSTRLSPFLPSGID
jgi:hypothetical protein